MVVPVFWYLWFSRNACIFEDKEPLATLLITKLESFLALHPVPHLTKKSRQIGPKPHHTFPVLCSAIKQGRQLNKGGAGFVIYISETHYYSFSVGCGLSTNTRAELLALWSVLRVCYLMGLPIQMIYGDSMVIIQWVNRLSALHAPTFKHWCDEIFTMIQLAPPVSFSHIFREHNMLADDLSKRALNLDVGTGFFSEILDGMVIRDGLFTLF